MPHFISSDVAKKRIGKWLMQATAVDQDRTWTERRMAIEFGGHTYLVVEGQIFQCAHCGYYDPEWSAVEVLKFFEENFGIKPHEIEITCSVAGN